MNCTRRQSVPVIAGLMVLVMSLFGVAAGFHHHAPPSPVAPQESPADQSAGPGPCLACRVLHEQVLSPLCALDLTRPLDAAGLEMPRPFTAVDQDEASPTRSRAPPRN